MAKIPKKKWYEAGDALAGLYADSVEWLDKSSAAVRAEAQKARMQRAKDGGFSDEVFYHASKQDIDEFVPGYSDGLTFLTPNSEFANNWLGKGKFQNRKGETAEAELKLAEKEQRALRQKYFDMDVLDSVESAYPNIDGRASPEWVAAYDKMSAEYLEKLNSGPLANKIHGSVYPVRTKVQKIFNPNKDWKEVRDFLEETQGYERNLNTDEYLKSGNYLQYENKEIRDFLESKGYDAMRLSESSDGVLDTLAVFNPKDIRSVNAQFDPAKRTSSNLLASSTGAAALVGMGAALSGQPAEAGVVSQLARLGYYVNDLADGGLTLYKKTGEKVGNFEYFDDAISAAKADSGAVPESGSVIDALVRNAGDSSLPDFGYRGGHTAPIDPEYHAPLHDMTQTYPDDIYSRNGPRYYGHGDAKLDNPSFDVINAVRGKPEAPVTMYRAVPNDAPDEIFPGDWVTANETYARQHGEGLGEYKILKGETQAKRLRTDGNSPHEYGYTGAAMGAGILGAAALTPQEAEAGVVNVFNKGRQLVGEFDDRFLGGVGGSNPRVNLRDRVANMETSVTPRDMSRPSNVNLYDYEGSPYILTQSDRSAAGGELTGINNTDISPVDLRGGRDYMFDPKSEGTVWASAPSVVNSLGGRASVAAARQGKDTILLPYSMAPTGIDFATMPLDTMVGFARANMSKANKKALDKGIKDIIPEWNGVADPDSVEVFRTVAGPKRKAIADLIDKKFRNVKGGMSISEARAATSDPAQMITPDGEITNLGTINATDNIAQSTHPTYTGGLRGEGVGVLSDPLSVRPFMEQNGRVLAGDSSDIRALSMNHGLSQGIIDSNLLKSVYGNANPLLLGGIAATTAAGLALSGEAEAGPTNIIDPITGLIRKGIEAWHGSPHKFDKFSMDNIGTGEGAQAYGHGLYFADSEDVAKGYREGLTKGNDNSTFYINDREIPYDEYVSMQAGDSTVEAEALYLLDLNKGDVNKTYNDITQSIDSMGANQGNYSAAEINKMHELERFVKENDLRIKGNGGALYRTELDVDPDTLLDWDKPLSEQPDNIKSALAPYMDAEGRFMAGGRVIDNPTGKQIYYNVVPDANDAAFATAKMQELGMPGIRYLDGDSRNRPAIDIQNEFLNELPEDASIEEVVEMLGTGQFSPKNEELISALDDDNWLGFDFPAQAISVALGRNTSNYDVSPRLTQAVKNAQVDNPTSNYVMFDDSKISIKERGMATPAALAATAVAGGAGIGPALNLSDIAVGGAETSALQPLADQEYIDEAPVREMEGATGALIMELLQETQRSSQEFSMQHAAKAELRAARKAEVLRATGVAVNIAKGVVAAPWKGLAGINALGTSLFAGTGLDEAINIAGNTARMSNDQAVDQGFAFLDKPMQGYQGMASVASGLVTGEGIQGALNAGADTANRSVDENARLYGDMVYEGMDQYDATRPLAPAFGALTYGGMLVGAPF